MGEVSEPAKRRAKLTNRERLFIEYYLACWNATEAARLAGYAHPRQAGSRLLSNVDIQAAIEARIGQVAMQANEVLLRLANHARFDPLEFAQIGLGPAGGYAAVDLNAIRAAGLGNVVKKIFYDKHNNLTVEFHDGQAALKLIGQHHKLFTQRHEIDVPELAPLPELLAQMVAKVYGGKEEVPVGEAPEGSEANESGTDD